MRITAVIRLQLLLFAVFFSSWASSQVVTVSGTVYSSSTPLPGINVSLSSTTGDGTVSTRTDGEGNYSLEVTFLPSDGDQANIKFKADDPNGRYKSLDFGAILYLDKTDGYDFYMEPVN